MVSFRIPIIWLIEEDSPWAHLVAEVDSARFPVRAGRRPVAIWDGTQPLREIGSAALIMVGTGPFDQGFRSPDLFLPEPAPELLTAAAFALSFGFGLVPGSAGLGAGAGASDAELTAREHQVLDLIAAGRANKEIAAELGLNLGTVKFHISNLFAKLGAKSRAELISRAAREGYLGV